MNNITYKVIFRGSEEAEAPEQALIFKNVISNNLIYIPPDFITSIKALSEKSNDIIYFQNISEVVIQGWDHNPPNFNYYLVLLLLSRIGEEKEAFLIGNIKKIKGDILIGIWPFTKDVENINSKSIQYHFDSVITNFEDYRKISIIHS